MTGFPPRQPLAVPALPAVIGHRGAAGLAPENTLAGLRRAAALGVGMVEVDVKLTRDAVPILMHDDRLDRTSDGTGLVREASWSLVRRLDAGTWFDPEFAGEAVPSLTEALELAAALGLAINLEIKPCPGRERETAEIALAVAKRAWPTDRPPPLVSSFARAAMAVAQAAVPEWPRGYLIWRRPWNWRATAAALDPATIHVHDHGITRARLAEYRSLGRPILAYTVNDGTRARQLFAQGVTAVFSDRPDTILAALAATAAPSASAP